MLGLSWINLTLFTLYSNYYVDNNIRSFLVTRTASSKWLIIVARAKGSLIYLGSINDPVTVVTHCYGKFLRPKGFYLSTSISIFFVTLDESAFMSVRCESVGIKTEEVSERIMLDLLIALLFIRERIGSGN